MNAALCAEHLSRNTLNAFIQRSRAFTVRAGQIYRTLVIVSRFSKG